MILGATGFIGSNLTLLKNLNQATIILNPFKNKILSGLNVI